jgi:hypothetical protein
VHYRRREGETQRAQFAVQSEPEIQVVLISYGPEGESMHPPKGELVVYVGHGSGTADVAAVPEAHALAGGPRPLCVVEPRGFGQSLPLTSGSRRLLEPYGSDYLAAATHEMLGESLLGRRVFDILRALSFLCSGGATAIELVGRGLGAVLAAFAGLLHESRPNVRLLDYLPSFALLAEDSLANWPLSSLPRGVLRHFDLPDVYRALDGRLELGSPWGARLDPDAGPVWEEPPR